MKTSRCALFVCVLVLTVFFVHGALASDEQSEADYQEAMALKDSGKYDEAYEILRRLASAYPDNTYQLAFIDTTLEQLRILREEDNPAWKAKAKEAQWKIKSISKLSSNRNDPEFWLLYAKFSGLVEKDRHFKGGLKKFFYFKPEHVDGYILKGDIYFFEAKITDPDEFIKNDSASYTGKNYQTNKSVSFLKGEDAMSAYKSALSAQGLNNENKSAVFFKMGELSLQILNNIKDAIEFWNRSAELSSDNTWGKRSVERLKTYR